MSTFGYKLFSLEGLDGCGKATQAKNLVVNLRDANRSVYDVSFPNYNSKSSVLAKMYLNSEFTFASHQENVYAVSSFFAVDRYVSYISNWKKYCDEGQIIVADRYTSSNAVYQLSSLDRKNWDFYLDWLLDYEYNKLGLPRPDMVIYLDMPVEKSQELVLKRYSGNESKKDLYERDIYKLYGCREAAMYVSKKFGWKVVECVDKKTGNVKSVDEISKVIFNLVLDVIE